MATPDLNALIAEYNANKENYTPEQQARIESIIANAQQPKVIWWYKDDKGYYYKELSDGSVVLDENAPARAISWYKDNNDWRYYKEMSDGSVVLDEDAPQPKAKAKSSSKKRYVKQPKKDDHDYSKDQSFIPKQVEQPQVQQPTWWDASLLENVRWWVTNSAAKTAVWLADKIGKKKVAQWLWAPKDISDKDAEALIDSMIIWGQDWDEKYDQNSLAFRWWELAWDLWQMYVWWKALKAVWWWISAWSKLLNWTKVWTYLPSVTKWLDSIWKWTTWVWSQLEAPIKTLVEDPLSASRFWQYINGLPWNVFNRSWALRWELISPSEVPVSQQPAGALVNKWPRWSAENPFVWQAPTRTVTESYSPTYTSSYTAPQQPAWALVNKWPKWTVENPFVWQAPQTQAPARWITESYSPNYVSNYMKPEQSVWAIKNSVVWKAPQTKASSRFITESYSPSYYVSNYMRSKQPLNAFANTRFSF